MCSARRQKEHSGLWSVREDFPVEGATELGRGGRPQQKGQQKGELLEQSVTNPSSVSLTCLCQGAGLEAACGQRTLPPSSEGSTPPGPAGTGGVECFLLSYSPIVLMWIPGSQTAAWFMRWETGANQPHVMGPNYLGTEWLEPSCPFPPSDLSVPPSP